LGSQARQKLAPNAIGTRTPTGGEPFEQVELDAALTRLSADAQVPVQKALMPVSLLRVERRETVLCRNAPSHGECRLPYAVGEHDRAWFDSDSDLAGGVTGKGQPADSEH
jgi:hypothetical protein